jgi:hypothetical protein
VRPDLIVELSGLTPEAVKVFMQIEKPEKPLVFQEVELEALGEIFSTIGKFYEAIRKTFHELPDLKLSVDRQISGPLAPLIIESLASVDLAIGLIRTQGEGSGRSPLGGDTVPAIKAPDNSAASPAKARLAPDLAHYYRFQELDRGRMLVYQEKTEDFRWADKLDFPTPTLWRPSRRAGIGTRMWPRPWPHSSAPSTKPTRTCSTSSRPPGDRADRGPCGGPWSGCSASATAPAP